MGFKIIYNYAIGFMENILTSMVHTLKLYVFGQHYIITFECGMGEDTTTFLYVTQFHYNIYNIYTWWRKMGRFCEANIENIEKVVD